MTNSFERFVRCDDLSHVNAAGLNSELMEEEEESFGDIMSLGYQGVMDKTFSEIKILVPMFKRVS